MRYLFILLSLIPFSFQSCTQQTEANHQKQATQPSDTLQQAAAPTRQKEYALVIHGGAGNISREMDEAKKQAHLNGLKEALETGKKILEAGGSSLDAVEATVRVLENNPQFNAGRGAVMTAAGKHELDAAIMNGSNLACGAVTGLTTVKNPISLARLVMEKSPHVFYWSDGAEKFADEMKIERVKNTYFTTDEVAAAFRKRQEKMRKASQDKQAYLEEEAPGFALGTVGAVALDKQGNLAAATSTGGRSGKAHGRIGDSPVIGAGTYANNHTCAISATGAGEEFIRRAVAYDVSALMAYKNLTLQQAAGMVIRQKLKPGDGGIIGVDKYGNIIQEYNTKGMYRGAVDSEGLFEVKIWED